VDDCHASASTLSAEIIVNIETLDVHCAGKGARSSPIFKEYRIP